MLGNLQTCYAIPIPVSQLPYHDTRFSHTVRLDTVAGQLIIEKIVPRIAEVRDMLALRLDTLLSNGLLTEINHSSSTLSCTDFEKSDLLLDSIQCKLVQYSSCTFIILTDY